MIYSDGLIVRCPECGTLNVVLNDTMDEALVKCMNCEGTIHLQSSWVKT